MKKRQLLLSAMLVLMGTAMTHAQKAYTYVQQDGTKIDKLGTAAFEVSATSHPTFEFVNGKAVMTIGENTVAALPMSDKGQLVIEFETSLPTNKLNTVTKTVSDEYATLYSPFQLKRHSDSSVEVYAPTYDAETRKVACTEETLIASSAVIPVEKALLLKNNGTINFEISAAAATDTHVSALSGSSLMIDVPAVAYGCTLYTLGHEATDNTKYGFFKYTGSKLNPGLAWLEAPSLTSASGAKYYAIVLDDEATGVSDLTDETIKFKEGKFIENGRVVIVRGGKKYNLNGQAIQ